MASYASDIGARATLEATNSSATRGGDIAARATIDATNGPTARGSDIGTRSTLDATKPIEGRYAPNSLERTLWNAVLVPGDFRGVAVVVVDTDWNRLTGLDQLLVLSPFPASTRIDEKGVGQLPLLSASYTDFRGLAPRGDNVGYMWYEGVENVVGPQDDEAVIVLDPVEIKGMYAGSGVDMGGPLR